MPRKSRQEIEAIFRESFTETKAERPDDWSVEDTEYVALKLINAAADKTGKEVKIPQESLARIKAALLILPSRILPFLAGEMEAAGAIVDETTKMLLARVLDLAKFRQELVGASLVKATGRGKKRKTAVADLLKP